MTSVYNVSPAEQRALLARTTRAAAPAPVIASEWFPDLIHAVIDAGSAGDNTLLASPGGRIFVHAIELWNVTAQTITLSNGPTASAANRFVRLTSFGDRAGYLLGTSKMPWFITDNSQPLVLNLSVGSQVDGFIKYRIVAA